jgi:Arc/MetJ family transcription regulator
MDEALVKQLKQRVETELVKREREFVEYWLEELLKIDAKRHKELAALQNDIKNLISRMQTRLKSLRSS